MDVVQSLQVLLLHSLLGLRQLCLQQLLLEVEFHQLMLLRLVQRSYIREEVRLECNVKGLRGLGH